MLFDSRRSVKVVSAAVVGKYAADNIEFPGALSAAGVAGKGTILFGPKTPPNANSGVIIPVNNKMWIICFMSYVLYQFSMCFPNVLYFIDFSMICIIIMCVVNKQRISPDENLIL